MRSGAFDERHTSGASRAARHDAPGTAQTAKIGPNALIQTVRALQEVYHQTTIETILRQSGQEALLYLHPAEMVEEQEFVALATALVAQLGISEARTILKRAGQLTAAYLLQYRIPWLFQQLLKPLPHQLALKLLLFAISKNAWTFAGSGRFSYHVGQPSQLTVTGHIQPIEAIGGFYGGTFEQLIHSLIDAKATMHAEVSTTAGQTACVYQFIFN